MRLFGIAFLLALAKLDVFNAGRVQGWIEVGGPLVIFGLLFACGLGLPLPEDIPLLIGGFFAAKGQMHLAVVAVLAWCGIIGGDCVLYHLGKKYGLNITRVPLVGRHLTKERILKAERLFDKYGVWVVAVGRLFAGVRGAMVVAAGAIRFNFVKFLIADGLAALVSGGLFVAIGYYFGKKFDSVEDIQRHIRHREHEVIAVLVVVVVGVVIYFWWRHKQHKPVVDATLDTFDPAAKVGASHIRVVPPMGPVLNLRDPARGGTVVSPAAGGLAAPLTSSESLPADAPPAR